MDPISQTDRFHLDVYNRFPVTLVKGEGALVWDDKGNEYIDALAGIAVNSLGHCHPKVVQAIREQSGKLMHISNFYYSRPQTELVRLLADISGMDRVFLCNSGAESIEAALKLARKYAKKNNKGDKLVTMSNAFHGRTLATISMGMDKYAKGYDPLLIGFEEIPFNDLDALQQTFENGVYGIILETIQGSGGLSIADQEFMSSINKLCKQYGVLLIIDEVQTGMGRTGKLFGYHHYGVDPDIICLAKALGGGFPIGAMMAKEEVASVMKHGDHGSTYGGNPLACAAAVASVSSIINEKLPKQAAEKGDYLMKKIKAAATDVPAIREVRGRGLMIGVELAFNGRAVVDEMLKRGILSNCTQGNVMRLVPPLVISREQLDRLCEVLLESIKAVQ